LKTKQKSPSVEGFQKFDTLATISRIDPRANWHHQLTIKPRCRLHFPHHPAWVAVVENWGPGVIIVDHAAVSAGEFVRVLDSAGVSQIVTHALEARVEITRIQRTERILAPRKVVAFPA
jgi:hypothetical protein